MSSHRRFLRAMLGASALGIGLAACGYFPISRTSRRGAAEIEAMPKPQSAGGTWHDCPVSGSSPDRPLNRLKNRVDEGDYRDVDWSIVARLPWPRSVGLRFRNTWTADEAREVARYEGAAVRVVGHLANYRLEIPEPTNCYSLNPERRDYHIWLSRAAGQNARRSIVVEITPRVREGRPAWTEERLRALKRGQQPVRVSGWLLLDQDHPENVGGNRVTLWEVHPIMALEWQAADGRWLPLDSLRTTRDTTPAAPPGR